MTKRIVLLGDSIRRGYEDTVKRQLVDQAYVWAPDDNSRDSHYLLAHLDRWVIERQPDLVHLNCGLWDLKRERDAEGAVVSLEQYRANLTHILSRVQAETQAQIIWATTTPVNEVWHQSRKEFDRYEADVLAYNATALAVCRQLKVPVNDLYAVIMAAGRDRLLQEDGVHYSPEGYVLLGQAVVDMVSLYL